MKCCMKLIKYLFYLILCYYKTPLYVLPSQGVALFKHLTSKCGPLIQKGLGTTSLVFSSRGSEARRCGSDSNVVAGTCDD